MYFRNKFNKEFLFLCDRQEPKGGEIRMDSTVKDFWIFRKRNSMGQPQTVEVIPLLLFNKLESDNKGNVSENIPADVNMEDYMMVCQDISDTTITCSYDPYYQTEQSTDFICEFGIKNITGDLSGN